MQAHAEDIIVKVIIEHTAPGLLELLPTPRLNEDLGIDSLERIEIAMQLEELFEIPAIPTNLTDEWKTVSDVLSCMDRQLEAFNGQLSKR